MTPAAFLDANVAIYATGADRALASACSEVLKCARFSVRASMSDSEVLQEIFHVLLRRGLRERGRETMALLDEALDGRVEAVTREDVLRAAEFDLPPSLQARDRVHIAVMERLGVTRIISADAAYDAAPGVERLDPLTLSSWRDAVFADEA